MKFLFLLFSIWTTTTAFGETFRVTALTPRMLRLQYCVSGLEEQKKASGRIAKTYEKDGFFYLETEALTLRYLLDSEIKPEMQSADELRITFPLGNHKVIWYPGKDDALNLKGVLPEDPQQLSADPREDLLPGLISRAGWSIVPLAPTTSDSFDWLFLGYGHDYEQAVRDFKATPYYQEKRLYVSSDASAPLFLPLLAATASNVGATYFGIPWDKPLRDDDQGVRLMQLSVFLAEQSASQPDSIIERRIDSLDNVYALRRAFELQRSIRTYKDSIQSLGINLCRPLYYDSPHDNNAYIYEDEFLCGTDLLVAPILRKAADDGIARRSVWIPAGVWMDVVNHRLQEGPKIVTVECSLSDIPYFIRQRQ